MLFYLFIQLLLDAKHCYEYALEDKLASHFVIHELLKQI